MRRPLGTCILGLLAAAGCASRPDGALPDPVDVSGDDCTASAFVYDTPPARALDGEGIPFINDGCFGDRIFLGIHGARRELKRAENVPLGTGGEYSDGEYRVLVKRGAAVRRVADAGSPEETCHEPGEREYGVTYPAEVRVRSSRGSWLVNGTLRETECAP